MKLTDLIWSQSIRLLKLQNLFLQTDDKLTGKGKKNSNNTIKIQTCLQFPN